jgi:hypothetical protein
MRHYTAILSCVIALCLAGGCSKKPATTASPVQTAEATGSPATTLVPGAVPTPSSSPTAPIGELQVSPGLDIAFTPICSVKPAGLGPRGGYTLFFAQSDQVSYGVLRVPEYAGADGTFGETSTLLTSDPSFAIVLKQNSLVATQASSIATTITEHGLKGLTSLGNFQLNGNATNSGTITWECTQLSH